MPQVKEEIYPDMDLFSCLDGFSLILGVGGDVIYVSDNVSKYIGLTQVGSGFLLIHFHFLSFAFLGSLKHPRTIYNVFFLFFILVSVVEHFVTGVILDHCTDNSGPGHK